MCTRTLLASSEVNVVARCLPAVTHGSSDDARLKYKYILEREG